MTGICQASQDHDMEKWQDKSVQKAQVMLSRQKPPPDLPIDHKEALLGSFNGQIFLVYLSFDQLLLGRSAQIYTGCWQEKYVGTWLQRYPAGARLKTFRLDSLLGWNQLPPTSRIFQRMFPWEISASVSGIPASMPKDSTSSSIYLLR